jgi:GTP-binding protein EngB required for normal cell division
MGDYKPPATSLASGEHEELLNLIDSLRSQGVGRFIALPELIVTGDQSSGKSSVLEALSGLSFPAKEQLCTRFATEVILRRSEEHTTQITIIGHDTKSAAEQKALQDFNNANMSEENISEMVKAAEKPMGIDGTTKRFSNDVLRIEYSAPAQPNLTLVDLPGFFHSQSKDQTRADIIAVRDLVLSYMKKPRSVILAVMSAKNDINNQIVSNYAAEMDPHGQRTLGIITKPDTLDVGSENERSFYDLAKNEDVEFSLGWHVLKNRDYESRACTSTEQDQKEGDFFSKGIWASLPKRDVGIDSLRKKLSQLLQKQIESHLPGLIKDVKGELERTGHRLGHLGASRENYEDQRNYLLTVSQSFTLLTQAAVDGKYDHPFFRDLEEQDAISSGSDEDIGTDLRRLRAVVQNSLTRLADNLDKRGQTYKIVDLELEVNHGDHEDEDNETIVISRADYITKAEREVKHNRGRELPVTFNPQIIGELFSKQSRKWERIVAYCVEDLLDAANETLRLVLEHSTDKRTADQIRVCVMNPEMARIEEELKEKVTDVLLPYMEGHPITYNSTLTDHIMNGRKNQMKRRISSRLHRFFDLDNNHKGGINVNKTVNIQALVSALCDEPEADMSRHACAEAIDVMQAYYQVCR